LVFIPPVARHDVLAGLYTACNAFVAPSRAEGWGLPIIEAMACGLPVITTDHSAPRDYLGAESYRVSCRMIPIPKPFFEPSDGDFGMWAEPNVADLSRRMREVYANPETAKTRGETAGARIRSRFTWDAAAGQAVSALAEFR
jgi:glycosyltransferase involved in cell wall biosynthesis